jgi:hypothetical protein
MLRKNRKGLPSSLPLAAVFFAACGAAQATTINAHSPSVNDVRTAIASAADGDTVIVPAGTAVWRSGLTIAKGITLQGQTTTDSTKGTAVDNTIIQDSDERRRSGGYPFIIVESQLGKSYRITGLTFDGGSATTTNFNGAIKLLGNSHAIRVDHCSIRASVRFQANYFYTGGAVWGVIDHNVLKTDVAQTFFKITAPAWPNPDGSDGGTNGDGSWAQPSNFGSGEFVFIENNWLEANEATHGAGGTDDVQGGRWVFRYNHCRGDIEVQSHGTENGRQRGGRAREIYNNDFVYNTAHSVAGTRSGVTIIHDNTFAGSVPPGPNQIGGQAYRSFFQWPGAPFHGATGDNPWDVNATEPDGSHVDGHPPYLFESGTATGGGRSQIIDTTKNWATNHWAGFTAKFTGDNQVALIQSNTSNTLNVFFYNDSGGGHVWQAGDGYQIHKLLIALDQPGRGQGDLIINDPPINSRTGSASWPNQQLDPIYCWNNVYTPTGAVLSWVPTTGGFMLQSGRDYYNGTPKPGYTPYTYPHPLTRGLPPPEQMTPNAPGNSQQDPRKKRQPWGGKEPEGKKAKKAQRKADN